MYIGGLDVGTTGCKISVYDENGRLFNDYYQEYESIHKNGQHEINFNDIKSGVLTILKKASNDCHLSALGITSFGETFAMLDENDNVLSFSMLYTDPRGAEECKSLCNSVGEEKLTYITGVKPNQMYSISKIMWWKNNKPEIYSKTKYILLGEDFIIYTLTGIRKIDYSLAARTAAFDIRHKCWCKEIFDAAKIDVSLMSSPVKTGSIAGKISDNIKKILDIDYDITIVNGAHDQVAAIIGAGVFEKGQAMDGTGTCECIPVILDAVPEEKSLYDQGYSVVPYLNNKYACYALSFTGGATLKWFRDNFSEIEKEKYKNPYEFLDKSVSEKPTGILVLPHFSGAATPYMDTESKAAFVGITLETTKYDLYKALMEGTSYEMLLNFNCLKKFTGEVSEIRATGGGALSDVWLQIKADILNTEIIALSCKEVGAAGTAALAGIAIKCYNDLYNIISKISVRRKRFEPNKNKQIAYMSLFKKYEGLYSAIKNL